MQLTTSIILITLNIALTTQKTILTHHVDVHEIINEQSRIDKPRNDKGVTMSFLYTNPLAFNAKIHAQNQQAMFKAEKMRQHRAQTQRWTKAPPQVDSYMKAFRESQENHHLALEQQHTTSSDIIGMTTPATKAPPRFRTYKHREVKPKVVPHPEAIVKSKDTKTKINSRDVIKFTKEDARVVDKNRNHRSHGSVMNKDLFHKRYQTVYLLPGTTYDQGVTIKPNGINTEPNFDSKQLYTEAIPSNSPYTNPLHYGQTYIAEQENYDTLNNQLNKEPQQQLEEIKDMLNSAYVNTQLTKDNNENTHDIYSYLKDMAQNYKAQTYEHLEHPETNKVKEFIPIMEEVDDIADPNINKIRELAFQPTYSQNPIESTTIKSNNYYKVEVASQVISGHVPKINSNVLHEQDSFHGDTNEQSVYAPSALQYAGEAYRDTKHITPTYIPEKHYDVIQYEPNQNSPIHHLTSEGTAVSAYGDDQIHYASNYEFGYRVYDDRTGNDFGHAEEKSGDKTKGQYHVLLPDGRVQNVKYFAGPEGFLADVSYDHIHQVN